uniref:Bm2750 n=1 Tax=Brugia malayi TaxID=6279 RepID=A0A0H5S949_BRUMA|nr:Bm2750 [Brugia malayi]
MVLNSTEQIIHSNRADEIYAAVICFTLSVFGIITNGAAIVVIIAAKNLQNAFGYSCMSHAVGDLGVLIIFAIWIPLQTPETIPQFLQNKRLAYTIGQATIIFYYGAIYTHVLIGLNRYVAIAKPFSYAIYFNERKTMKWITLIWIISFIQSCIYQFDGCHYYFDRSAMLFLYSDAPCAQIISLYYEFYFNLAFVIFVVLLDIITFFKLKKMAKPIHGFQQVIRRRRAQEIRYFIQSVCSETALILTFLCFWSVAIHATTPFSMFLLNIGAWLTMHAADGFIMTAFNHHIFTHIKKSAKRASLPMVTIALSATNKRTHNQALSAQKRWLHMYHESKLKPNKIEPSRINA